jgi:hypothetical protein
MRKSSILVLVMCSLFPLAAKAQPDIDCKSARAIPPNVDEKTVNETCRARAAAERAKAGGPAAINVSNVFDARTNVAGATTALASATVPTWTDADILAQFASTRDTRYMTTSDHPGFQRRISWMYPDNGCFARAEQVNVRVVAAGKARPAKLFVFGAYNRGADLHVSTSNATSGSVNWQYHVVPVVKNSAGEPIVFDAALSPCRPLPWKDWLLLMAPDLSFYDNLAANNGITVASSGAYAPYSLVTGEQPHEQESLNDQIVSFLPAEWYRQETDMGRDPNVVLGSSPPWSGFACVTADIRQTFTTVAANTSKTVTTNCPFATLAAGGGYGIDSTGVTVSKTARSGNGWQVVFKNTTGSTKNVAVSANCLTGAPANASVTTVSNTVSAVQPGSTATASAACSSGTLIGGGYSTTQGSTSVMRVFKNGRSSTSGSSWQVSVNNTTFTAKDVTAFGYCLANTGFTFSRTSASLDNGGVTFAICSPNTVLGGGHQFPSSTNLTVTQMYPFGSQIFVTNMSPIPPNGDPNALGFAECLAHP